MTVDPLAALDLDVAFPGLPHFKVDRIGFDLEPEPYFEASGVRHRLKCRRFTRDMLVGVARENLGRFYLFNVCQLGSDDFLAQCCIVKD